MWTLPYILKENAENIYTHTYIYTHTHIYIYIYSLTCMIITILVMLALLRGVDMSLKIWSIIIQITMYVELSVYFFNIFKKLWRIRFIFSGQSKRNVDRAHIDNKNCNLQRCKGIVRNISGVLILVYVSRIDDRRCHNNNPSTRCRQRVFDLEHNHHGLNSGP